MQARVHEGVYQQIGAQRYLKVVKRADESFSNFFERLVPEFNCTSQFFEFINIAPGFKKEVLLKELLGKKRRQDIDSY